MISIRTSNMLLPTYLPALETFLYLCLGLLAQGLKLRTTPTKGSRGEIPTLGHLFQWQLSKREFTKLKRLVHITMKHVSIYIVEKHPREFTSPPNGTNMFVSTCGVLVWARHGSFGRRYACQNAPIKLNAIMLQPCAKHSCVSCIVAFQHSDLGIKKSSGGK